MRASIRTITAAAVLCLVASCGAAQSNVDLAQINKIPAVSGHEEALSKALLVALKDFAPKMDNMGNVYVTLGSGAPHRLIATAIDEPGYVVSEITPDGYLRVQRLPQAAPNAVFDTLNFAQPVWVVTRSGKQVPGVFAGLSVHLQPGRLNPPKMNHVEELYVDIGAKSATAVGAAGIRLLDVVVAPASLRKLEADHPAGYLGGVRFGLLSLLRLLQEMDLSEMKGTVTVAFVTQQWIGGRGLNRLLTEMAPDEMVFVGHITPRPPLNEKESLKAPEPGSGVLIGTPYAPEGAGGDFVEEFRKLAEQKKIPLSVLSANPPRIAGYVAGASYPKRFAMLDVPTLWPATTAETLNLADVVLLNQLIGAYVGKTKETKPIPLYVAHGSVPGTIENLVVAYGASGREGAVREEVKRLLPEWARKKVTTDAAGNLVLHVGDGKRSGKTTRIAFVAHMDEIGYEVKKIEDDGRLQVDVLGGGYTQYFLGHAVLVHRKKNNPVSGVLELPTGWDKPGFEWPSGPRAMDEPAHVYIGTKTREETEKLGIALGDFVTLPKEYRPLLGTRASARSFDDRVGCAALIEAVKAIGPDLQGRDVTFVWSTEEEVGLKGAAAFAEQAAKEGRVPDFVFAIDTFVSSDSPLESKRFGDAELGKGFVVRAVDNSNIVPLQYVDRVVAMAKENKIPVQYGVTGGGNDGAVFTRYGSVDVALGWPLRYSHSAVEVIDAKDLDSLGKIVEVLARKW